MRMLTYIIGVGLMAFAMGSAYDWQSAMMVAGIGAVVSTIFWEDLAL